MIGRIFLDGTNPDKGPMCVLDERGKWNLRAPEVRRKLETDRF